MVLFEPVKREARQLAKMLRRMGKFEPARLGLEELDHTSMSRVL
ncbi:fructose 1,6-bisphosphatase [Candidatus Bathyarchaeota archaeon]|jgi:fructose 1,6-bisphosphatase|nr:fructose 1,6-bisphosphatase [Candidatus Bathyarchaeota archaeon]